MTYMQKKTRIALVTYGLHVGGLLQSKLRMFECLRDRGFETEIITTEARGEECDRVAQSGVPVHHVDFHPLGAFFHIFRVGRRLARGDYDVLILFHAKYAQAALRMLPDKVVTIPTIRLDDEVMYEVGLANGRAWNAILGNSHRVCAVARKRAPGRPVICIPNGVPQPSRSKLPNRRCFSKDIRLIFVGRLAEHKGIKYLPDILKHLVDRDVEVHLDIVGDGPERGMLANRFHQLGLAQKTSFHGSIAHESVYDFLLDSHILLLPTLAEGLPNVLLEAQACGCVPVASRLEGVTDMAVADGQTGILVDLGDSDGFAHAIASLARDNALWDRMSSAGPTRIAEKFSVQRLGASYAKLIADALEGKYALPKNGRSVFPVDLTLFSWREYIPPFAKAILRPLCFWRRLRRPTAKGKR